jgi:hypothetical protein
VKYDLDKVRVDVRRIAKIVSEIPTYAERVRAPRLRKPRQLCRPNPAIEPEPPTIDRAAFLAWAKKQDRAQRIIDAEVEALARIARAETAKRRAEELARLLVEAPEEGEPYEYFEKGASVADRVRAFEPEDHVEAPAFEPIDNVDNRPGAIGNRLTGGFKLAGFFD